ncbi:hypothetical protein IC229_06800 [Spirosoma sp. BT702]|uniref:Uncharacterized protein n=1 Tax=Spirosoma profusum TaxID=2771354 RepID=A0A927ARW4_9BACT|nr:hypothetical protein [Spirosoma profusum]MBD2700335.1 hypothetical protein [Spirosoma profusum]
MRTILFALSMIGFLTVGYSAKAQSTEAYARPDSARAYWKLSADFTDQTPLVQFYNARHQLLYQEQLPQNVRHLNRQTQRALDVLLANLVNNRILATAYLPENQTDLSENSVAYLMPASGKSLKQSFIKGGKAIFFVDPTIDQAGKLTIHCAQSKKRISQITLEDENRKTYYQGAFADLSYKFSLNLQELQSGNYTLKIGHPAHTFTYRLVIDHPVQRFALQMIE